MSQNPCHHQLPQLYQSWLNSRHCRLHLNQPRPQHRAQLCKQLQELRLEFLEQRLQRLPQQCLMSHRRRQRQAKFRLNKLTKLLPRPNLCRRKPRIEVWLCYNAFAQQLDLLDVPQ
jgi:hypothetical protein